MISSTDIPRIIIVELCEPQLPPVLISIGINDTSAGIAAHASSYFQKSSRYRRRQHQYQQPKFCFGVFYKIRRFEIRFLRWIDSRHSFDILCCLVLHNVDCVVKVTIPTSLPSSSTTGIVTKSYLFISFATSSLSLKVCTHIMVLSIISHFFIRLGKQRFLQTNIPTVFCCHQ